MEVEAQTNEEHEAKAPMEKRIQPTVSKNIVMGNDKTKAVVADTKAIKEKIPEIETIPQINKNQTIIPARKEKESDTHSEKPLQERKRKTEDKETRTNKMEKIPQDVKVNLPLASMEKERRDTKYESQKQKKEKEQLN